MLLSPPSSGLLPSLRALITGPDLISLFPLLSVFPFTFCFFLSNAVVTQSKRVFESSCVICTDNIELNKVIAEI